MMCFETNMQTSRISRAKTKKEIAEIGLVCCNCGSADSVEYHHIVPLSLGGHDVTTNKCCLCYKCHSLIHFGKSKNISHSELTKRGLERAKNNGKRVGTQKGDTWQTKKSILAKKDILKYSKEFGGTLNDVECMRILGIARNTYYKYKKELKTIE